MGLVYTALFELDLVVFLVCLAGTGLAVNVLGKREYAHVRPFYLADATLWVSVG